jgi:uncharacterized membrane protein
MPLSSWAAMWQWNMTGPVKSKNGIRMTTLPGTPSTSLGIEMMSSGRSERCVGDFGRERRPRLSPVARVVNAGVAKCGTPQIHPHGRLAPDLPPGVGEPCDAWRMTVANDGGSVGVTSDRVESFSDAVFAIAITLLVLDIRQPTGSGALWDALLQQWPSFAAYAVSFLLIGVVWVNHHAVFHLIALVDVGLLWFNLLLLLDVAFMPYPTVLLANALISGRGQSTAAVCYGATLVVGGVFFYAIWVHAARRHRLLRGDAAPELVRAMGRRFMRGPLVCAVITPVALIQVSLSLSGYVLLLGYYGVVGIRDSRAATGPRDE